jgi:hypothetical protein
VQSERLAGAGMWISVAFELQPGDTATMYCDEPAQLRAIGHNGNLRPVRRHR